MMLFFREAPVVAVLGHGLFSVLSGFCFVCCYIFLPELWGQMVFSP